MSRRERLRNHARVKKTSVRKTELEEKSLRGNGGRRRGRMRRKGRRALGEKRERSKRSLEMKLSTQIIQLGTRLDRLLLGTCQGTRCKLEMSQVNLRRH